MLHSWVGLKALEEDTPWEEYGLPLAEGKSVRLRRQVRWLLLHWSHALKMGRDYLGWRRMNLHRRDWQQDSQPT